MISEILNGSLALVFVLSSGYSLLGLLLKKQVSFVEKLVFSIALGLTIPPLLLFALNFLLKLPLNFWSVSIVYLIFCIPLAKRKSI